MPTEEDDLYNGYDNSSPIGTSVAAVGAGTFQSDSPFSASAASAAPPGTASTRMGTAMRTGTAGSDGTTRPMTSNRGAGFSSNPRGRFDPLSQGKSALGSGTGSSLLPKKQEPSSEEVARGLEEKVHELLEASVLLVKDGSTQPGLEKALEARKKERTLANFRSNAGQADSHPPELGFAVEVQLASCYAANKLWTEALDLYSTLVKNSKGLPLQTSKFRVNMGNVYFEQGKYPSAIKQYRMALDALPPTAAYQRSRLMTNIGLAFVQMGQYADAASTFESALDMAPDHQAAFNLLVCCYALGDKEGMMAAFQRLLTVPGLAEAKALQEEEDEAQEEEDASKLRDSIASMKWLQKHEGAAWAGSRAGDPIKQHKLQQAASIKKSVLTAAQLLSEGATGQQAGGFAAGFDWAAEQLRQAGYEQLAAEVLLAKASRHLSAKEVDAAAAVYKGFERRGAAGMPAAAATNLSFLYLLEGDLTAAAHYTDLALKADRYNAQAHVNRGVVLLEAGSLEEALQAFSDAAAIQPLNVQALYNLGVVNLRLGDPEAALQPLKKLHTLLPDQPEVAHCLALAADMSGDSAAAIRWLEVLTSLVPHDPGVLCKLGAIYHRLEEEARSLGYYQEAHRVWPVNLDVISWLGAFHVRNEVYERALPYFELAAAIQPQEVKWSLMVASCHRRIGAFDQARERYQSIVAAHPGNVEALRYLVALCQQSGRAADAQRYGPLLRRAEVTEAAAAAAAAEQAQAPGANQQPRSGTGSDPGQAQYAAAAAHQNVINLDSHLAAKAGRPTGGAPAGRKAAGADDDWGEEPLGDDLLPM